MKQNKISILSTRLLEDLLIDQAKQAGIEIDMLSFIKTEPIQSTEVQHEIANTLLQSAAVVFTSMNAVEAVAGELHGQQPGWKIYSTGGTTKQLVKKYFGEKSIAGTAGSAAELAALITGEGNKDKVIFFCGDQRRNELPDILRSNAIDVNEITVYHTTVLPHKIEKQYHGILFFSPSAVESFFSNNKMPVHTILFAIGNTTATTIKKHCKNKIIIAEEPGKENMVTKMIRYYI